MKTFIRILNLIILAVSGAATALLFMCKPMTFDSKIAVDVNAFSKFVPETIYSQQIDIVKMLGTDTIEVAIKFDLDVDKTLDFMKADQNVIDNTIVAQNVKGITETLRSPVELITDFSIRSVIKSTLKDELTQKVQESIDNSDHKDELPSAAELMEDVGINDAYFTEVAKELYNSANAEGASVDSVSEVLFAQINNAASKAEDESGVEFSGFTEEAKAAMKENLNQLLNDLQLVEEGGTLKPIKNIAYIYLSKYLRDGLTGKVAPEKLEKQTVVDGGIERAETDIEYSDRLLSLYVVTMLPGEFYSIIGYVSIGLFVGLFVFAFIWGLLFIITLIKTFTNKPWTIFGPWFWILGSLQVVLGIGLTIFGKMIVPNLVVKIPNLPLKSAILAPRTYALIPSILFLGCIVLAIIYAIFRSKLKRQMKRRPL